MWQSLRIAFTFLTIIPLTADQAHSRKNWGRSALFYPLVGLVIGLSLFVAQIPLQGVPDLLLAAIILTIWVGVTGGLHLDGLADTADAIVGGHGDRGRMLQILQDPRCGPMGVITIVLVLLLKFVAISVVVAGVDWRILLFTPVGARALLLYMVLTTAYAKPEGIGAWLTSNLPRQQAIYILIVVVIVFAAVFTWYGIGIIFLLWIVAQIWRRWMIDRLGGFTGDLLGALCEITEVISLVFFAIVL